MSRVCRVIRDVFEDGMLQAKTRYPWS